MAQVFAIGAHLAHGGTYMTYHIARVLHERFGFDPVAVLVGQEGATAGDFHYPIRFPERSIDSMLDSAGPGDFLVAPPSFSELQLGTRFPGTSIMYVQGVNTYRAIDGFFDVYVAVSPFVRDHVLLHYGFDVPVIAPFVDTVPGSGRSWSERPPGSVLIVPKLLGAQLVEQLRDRLRRTGLERRVLLTVFERSSRTELLAAMGTHRYFLMLSPLEGHPLTPIEAMASGCCVVGFHGGGGLTYLENGRNAAVVGYPRLDAVVEMLRGLLDRPDEAQALARRGIEDAARFDDIGSFDLAWSHLLSPVVGRAPCAARFAE